MSQHPRAGQPALPSELVDVPALLRAYDEIRPDPSDPAQRVAFGTSGHRGSAFRAAFNEAHILATTEAICRYRAAQGTTGPLFIARDTHALSEPAWRTALEVLVGNGVDVRVDAEDGYTPTPSLSLAIIVANRGRTTGLADGIVVTPSHNPPDDGGFKYNPPNGGPADTDVTRWIQDEANRILEATGADGLDGIRRVPFERARAQAGEYDFRGAYVADLENVIDMAAIRGLRAAPRRRPAGRCGRRLLGPHRRALRPRPHRDQRDRGPAVRVHDPRLGRQDPDGPVLAVRDGAARGAARPVRPRPGQRRRRGPARDRRPGRRADEPQPRHRRGDQLPVRRRALVARGRRRGQDARLLLDHRPGHREPRPPPARGPGGLQVVRGRPRGRVRGLRRGGERRRLVPAPRRHGLDDRQGRAHRLPAGRGADREDGQEPRGDLRRAHGAVRRPGLPAHRRPGHTRGQGRAGTPLARGRDRDHAGGRPDHRQAHPRPRQRRARSAASRSPRTRAGSPRARRAPRT